MRFVEFGVGVEEDMRAWLYGVVESAAPEAGSGVKIEDITSMMSLK